MKKSLAVIALTFTLGACSLTPPPPAEAVDDGRGMVPINPAMVTQEQINAVSSKYKDVNKKQVQQLKEFAHGQ
ncbi:hypothetical protein P5F81_004463 [Salmonella enterica]|nr:hypothetical protein [Salmonella enterica]ELS3074848.1 hypothetical protein [Salmonella enterica]